VPPPPPPRCCDTGRPIFTDPITGQTVCSCQYDLLSYQRLAASGVPALSMYTAPYPEGMAAYFPALGSDQPPFYSAVSTACVNGIVGLFVSLLTKTVFRNLKRIHRGTLSVTSSFWILHFE